MYMEVAYGKKQKQNSNVQGRTQNTDVAALFDFITMLIIDKDESDESHMHTHKNTLIVQMNKDM
jgi:hypothetical protein